MHKACLDVQYAHDTYASSEFARRLVKYFPFKIKTIQTYKSQEESLFAIQVLKVFILNNL